MHPCLVRILHDSKLIFPSDEIRNYVAELLSPFCEKADCGVFGLAEKEDVSEKCVIDALGTAAAIDVRRVNFISVQHTLETRDEEKRLRYWDKTVTVHPFDLRHALWTRHDSVESLLGPEKACQLYDIVWRAIGEPLWHCFEENFWDRTGVRMRLGVRANLLVALAYVAAYGLLGDRGRLDQFGPLMRILPTTIPLGERLSRPGVWTALTE